MRIIAGAAKGRRLLAPPSGTRPLTGRAKEALFSVLGGQVVAAEVLDLFAGSGSLGLEALSRGATAAVFVERDPAAVACLERNIGAVGLGGTVVASDVERFLDHHGARHDLVFVDPPYSLPLASVERILALVAPRTRSSGTVVLHRRSGGDQPVVDELPGVDRRRYGDVELWILVKEEA